MKKPDVNHPPNERPAALLLIAIIAAFLTLCFAFYYGVSPTAGDDTYIYSSMAIQLLHHGVQTLDSGLFATREIIIFGEAFFMGIFGPGQLSVVLFAVLCGMGTIIALFVIGRELYGVRTGLIAAALYGFVPAVVVQASNSGDDIPMVFIATLAVMFLVLAMKRRKHLRRFYALSGFFAVIGFITVGEEVIICIFLGAILLWRLVHDLNRHSLHDLGFFFAGAAAAALVIMFLGVLQTGNPLFVFNAKSSWYSTTYCGSPSWNPAGCAFTSTEFLGNYLGMMFPYNILQKVSIASASGSTPAQLMSSIVNPAGAQLDYGYQYGYIFYALAAFAVLLLAFRDKRPVFPGVWFVTVLLYLSFGTMSATKYDKVSPTFSRYLLLLLPAAALIVALGITKVLEIGEHRDTGRKGGASSLRRVASYAIAAAILGLLLTEFVYLAQYSENSWYSDVYPAIQVGKFMASLPQNATIVAPVGMTWQQYAGYRWDTGYIPSSNASCSQMPNDSYIVYMVNETLQNECGLELVYSPPQRPRWLANYTMYMNQLMDFSDMRVYYKN